MKEGGLDGRVAGSPPHLVWPLCDVTGGRVRSAQPRRGRGEVETYLGEVWQLVVFCGVFQAEVLSQN